MRNQKKANNMEWIHNRTTEDRIVQIARSGNRRLADYRNAGRTNGNQHTKLTGNKDDRPKTKSKKRNHL